jgi:AcrR family transcriptional regulator
MTSKRHTNVGRHSTAGRHSGMVDNPAAAEVRGREVPAAILDATRAAVLAVGVRRTTLTDVARRAGVSRMTVYRLVPDVNTLILEVMTRDLGAVLLAAEHAARRRRSARARLVAIVVGVCTRLPREPLLRRILDVDPELLLPYLTDRWGATQRLAVGHVRRLVAEGHADGSIRRGDAETLASMLVLLSTPYVVSRGLLSGFDSATVTAELERLVDRWLAP